MIHVGLLIAVVCFFALLWAYSSKGPLHDWAREYPGWAAAAVFVVPPVVAILLA